MLFYDFILSLHFSHVDILWVSPHHKHLDGVYPDASMKASETSCVIIRSIEEIAIDLIHESIAKEVKLLCVS